LIKILKTKNEFGIKLLNIIELSIAKYNGLTKNTYTVLFGLFNWYLAIKLGKEKKDGKKTRQKIKESKNINASA
tara:strand:+ start:436 stop:657 length:222 start_codon:yes stop_codon:yes gene_type:complete